MNNLFARGREAYKVVNNKYGVFIEPQKWLEDASFCVNIFPDYTPGGVKKANINAAKFICEKMNRAFRTGRRVGEDAMNGIDAHGNEVKR